MITLKVRVDGKKIVRMIHTQGYDSVLDFAMVNDIKHSVLINFLDKESKRLEVLVTVTKALHVPIEDVLIVEE